MILRTKSLLLGLLLACTSPVGLAKVPLQPTANDELPAAILGKAGPPTGDPVQYFAQDPATLGYLAVPDAPAPHGAVILVHEWNGLVDRMRQVADALAAEGYVALAVDLYGGQVGSSRDENVALMKQVRGNQVTMIANLDAAVRYLKARPDVAGKVVTMGWCFGGGIALSYALGSDAHDGTAIFYGSLVDDPAKLSHLNHAIYGTFAANDRGIPVAAVNRFVAALKTAGIDNDVHIYDHVGHGFWLHVDRDPATATAPALDAWQRLKRYLDNIMPRS